MGESLKEANEKFAEMLREEKKHEIPISKPIKFYYFLKGFNSGYQYGQK